MSVDLLVLERVARLAMCRQCGERFSVEVRYQRGAVVPSSTPPPSSRSRLLAPNPRHARWTPSPDVPSAEMPDGRWPDSGRCIIPALSAPQPERPPREPVDERAAFEPDPTLAIVVEVQPLSRLGTRPSLRRSYRPEDLRTRLGRGGRTRRR